MQRVMPELGIPREKMVFISGIGCSSRFPYYMNTFGIHSIHGRAPTLATGLKLANPDLTVAVITGDGDGLSIGGNHLLHAMRRNVDIKIILFNNRIYGLTKGQYSPTSLPGTKTKSSPLGSIERAFNPISVALGAEATFVARTVDVDQKHMGEVLRRAFEHKGVAFVEIFQNCLIFNDGTWAPVTDKDVKDDNRVTLEHGKPLIFGKNSDKGIRMGRNLQPEVVALDQARPDELLIHDEHGENLNLAFALSRMAYPEFPVPIGVFHDVDHPVYEQTVLDQVHAAQQARGVGKLKDLYRADETWTVGLPGANGSNGHHEHLMLDIG
jgi:2-oxoglutarate ferredoxin oxidoreductase subunit beta